jgi:hypothetical protein
MPKTELEKLTEALEVAKVAMGYVVCDASLQLSDKVSKAIGRINAILAPDPIETEDVPVERWECDLCGKVRRTDPCGDLCVCFEAGRHDTSLFTWTKLTGTHKVEKKQPVVKSGTVTLYSDGSYCANIDGNLRSKVDDIECAITWEEPAA